MDLALHFLVLDESLPNSPLQRVNAFDLPDGCPVANTDHYLIDSSDGSTTRMIKTLNDEIRALKLDLEMKDNALREKKGLIAKGTPPV